MRIDTELVRKLTWSIGAVTMPAMTDDDLEEGDVVIIRHTGHATLWPESDSTSLRFIALSRAGAGEVTTVLAAPNEVFTHRDPLGILANQ